ncbi:MAG: FAD-dependent oxidoreductase [Actinomycetia bacterium]|nr:FAD-dependent oxidoreductase [Actinomycetes bacterium]
MTARAFDSAANGSASLLDHADVVVVGGGIAGSAAAWELARQGAEVVLVEKGDVADEQSGRNLGFVRQQLRDPVELPLMIASIDRWTRLSDDLEAEIEWVGGGNLALAKDDTVLAAYRTWVDGAKDYNLTSEIINDAEVRALLPGIAGEWAGGLFTPGDGQADPVRTTKAFANAAVREGARLRTQCTAKRVHVQDGRVTGVETSQGFVGARTVVCAAGIWTTRLLATCGVVLPQRVMRSTLTQTNPVERLTDAAVVAGGGTYFRQAASGSLLISDGKAAIDVTPDTFKHMRMFLPMYLANRSRFRPRLGWQVLSPAVRRRLAAYDLGEPEVDQRVVRSSLASLERLFPRLGRLQATRTWAGRIEGTPDALPVIDALRDPQGLIVVTGQSNHGFALGPIFGAVVADLITQGRSSFDLHPFRLSRFAEGAYGRPRSLIA